MNRRQMLTGLLGSASVAALATLTPLGRAIPGAWAREPLPVLKPGPRWTGKAGSGFRKAPLDPERVTAKPMMRLLVPPHQAFTDQLAIGVRAMANDRGTLFDNEGLAMVRLHYEGATLEITEPRFHEFADANGTRVRYFGWWAELAHSGIDGEGQIYFEAVPRDPSMQSRVIGPYSFLPSAKLHDVELKVAASAAPIEGSRYRTFADALNHLHGRKDVRSPRITFTQGGTIDPGAIFYLADIPGWCTVDATEPVTFAKPPFTEDGKALFRPKYGNFHFRGENIRFDFANAIAFYTEAGHRLWLDGVKIENSAGRARFYRRGPPNSNALFREKPWFTETEISDVKNPCANASLVRGARLARVVNDPFQDAAAVIGTFTDGCDAATLAVDRPAMTAHYRGRGRSATLEATNPSDSASRTFTARVDGKVAGTFTVRNSQAAATEGTHYTVRNVADWLNSLPGWTARMLDNDYRATALSIPDNRGAAFPATDMKRGPITLQTHFDLHSDFFGQNIGGLGENIIIADNVGIALDAQAIFYAARSPALKDAAFVNNALECRAHPFVASQFGNGPHSHLVVVHNSWAGQHLLLRSDQGWRGGPHTLIAANVMRQLNWTGEPDPGTRVEDNLTYGPRRGFARTVGSALPGDAARMFAAPSQGNFTPRGALSTRPIRARLRHDARGLKRQARAPAGAFI